MTWAQLLQLLLRDARGERRYWDRFDCLNSDGRRLLHSASKALLEEKPCLRSLVHRARKSPCLEELEKLYLVALQAEC